MCTGFAVNGSAIPEVDFDVGESYAGLLPIGGANETDQLYFWFFPTSAPEDPKEIIIWLTGGVSNAAGSSNMLSSTTLTFSCFSLGAPQLGN